MSAVFINNLDSALGLCLLEEFSPISVVSGSLSSPEASSPLQTVPKSDIPAYNSALLSADTIIFDFHTEDFTFIEEKIKLLKTCEFSASKTLICLSSVKVWGKTPAKTRPLTEEELNELEENNPEEDEKPPPPQFKTEPYTEEEYMKRKPLDEFRAWKGLETLALSVGLNKQGLTVYVLCAGITYGRGEDEFYELVKSAWLEDPPALPITGTGANHIPCIHISDLAKTVKYIVQTRPATRYIFAIDNSEDQTQENIVKSISKGIGTGQTVAAPADGTTLSLDIKLKPSSVLLPELDEEEEEEIEEEDEDEPKPKKEKFRIDWTCRGGLTANIHVLGQEFNSERGLVPVKIFLTGPPGAGKSYFSEKLAEFYNVPCIRASDVVKYAESLGGDFAEEFAKKMTDLKEEMIEKLASEKQDDEEIDSESIVPRIPPKLMAKAFALRLGENPCKNRGYVLDGFPKTYKEALALFMTKPKKEAEEEEEDENMENYVLNEDIVPQSTFLLEAEDAALVGRVKRLPEARIEGTHCNPLDMPRRLALYRAVNENTGEPTLHTFFEDHNREIVKIHSFESETKIFETMKIYIERHGTPINYQNYAQREEENRIRSIQKQRNLSEIARQQAEFREEALESETRDRRTEQRQKTLEQIHEQEREHLENLAQPAKNYMLENIYEILAAGLSEVSAASPEDPIEFLAKYLFTNADKVPHPDPSLY